MASAASPTAPSSYDSTSTRTNADHRWQQFEKTTDRPSFINTFDNLPEGWVVLAAEELAHRKPHYLPEDKIQQQRLRQLPFYGWMEPETTFADGTAWPRAATTSRLASCQVLEFHHDDGNCDVISQDTLVDDEHPIGVEAVTDRDFPEAPIMKNQRKRRGFFGKLRHFFAKILGRGKQPPSLATVRC